MKTGTKIFIAIVILAIVLILIVGGYLLHIRNADYYFYKTVPPDEAILRSQVVKEAQKWLGYNEKDGSHQQVIDIYNAHEPLAQGYNVKYDDEWCATFVSAVAIQCDITQIIPTECGCQRQIELFKELGTWIEDDSYKPLPGDIIYYSREDSGIPKECTLWSDHVGIVVGTYENYIKVIEGNYSDEVGYRYLEVDSTGIRGYAVPNYGTIKE